MKKFYITVFAILIMMSCFVLESQASPVESITVTPGQIYYTDESGFNLFAYVPKNEQRITITTYLADWGKDMFIVEGDGEKMLNDGENIFTINIIDIENETVFCSYTLTVTRADTGSDANTLVPVPYSLTMLYSENVYYEGGRLLKEYTLKYVLTTGDFTGDLPLFFHFGSDNDRVCMAKNLQANSIYDVTLSFSPSGMYNIGHPKTSTVLYSQAGGAAPVAVDLSVIGGSDNSISQYSTTIEYVRSTAISYPDSETIKIYAVGDELRINFPSFGNLESLNAEIFDISGRTVGAYCIRPNETINISHLSGGIYIVKIGSKTAKFVKR